MFFPFIKYSKVYYIISIALIGISIFSLVKFGLNYGIEFVGGSIIEIEYKDNRPVNQEISKTLEGIDLGTFSIQPVGDKGVMIKMKDINEETHQEAIRNLSQNGQIAIEEKRFESIGPVVGRELKQKTLSAIIFALIAIVSYIALAFRKVRRPISSLRYGVTALVSLFHDVLIPIGALALMGKFYGLQITIPIVAALLTIQGYSVHNTIVVFDRIRENLSKGAGKTFEETVDKSINQTLMRSFSTSFTVLLMVVAIFLVGGETLHDFAFTLIVGVIVGTYTSVLVASPLLVSWYQRGIKVKK
ncbi:MAG: protein translocase subunit SecF [Candidatus Parcubacteria bacterium]|nr:protein translocase subunit SecF [Candidatus Parcubacteria bacterium]